MGFWKSFAGTVRVQIVSAAQTDLLHRINQQGIILYDIAYTDGLTVEGSINRTDYRTLKEMISKRGETIRIVRKQGIYWTAKKLLHRPLLLIGMACYIILAIYIPSRVLFVKVEGNSSVSAKRIIEKAEQCGISFGASRREVRSEYMKNALLAAIPELQWAGVNTSGCVAVISVRERSTTEESEKSHGVSSIVAARDGVIRQCTVRQGNPLCKVGQAVKAGQVLVSGYTDCGISIKATRAEAEIYAQTSHNMEAVALAETVARGDITSQKTRYSILIGKKQINLYKDSGISDASCVKMYKKQYLTLPGGFQLPVALITEQTIYCDNDTAITLNEDDYKWIHHYSERYLQSHMIAGQLLSSDASIEFQDDTCIFYGRYSCLEMIGRVQSEEIIQGNGEDD